MRRYGVSRNRAILFGSKVYVNALHLRCSYCDNLGKLSCQPSVPACTLAFVAPVETSTRTSWKIYRHS